MSLTYSPAIEAERDRKRIELGREPYSWEFLPSEMLFGPSRPLGICHHGVDRIDCFQCARNVQNEMAGEGHRYF